MFTEDQLASIKDIEKKLVQKRKDENIRKTFKDFHEKEKDYLLSQTPSEKELNTFDVSSTQVMPEGRVDLFLAQKQMMESLENLTGDEVLRMKYQTMPTSKQDLMGVQRANENLAHILAMPVVDTGVSKKFKRYVDVNTITTEQYFERYPRNSKYYARLIRGFSEVQDFEGGKKLVAEMKEKKIAVTAEVYTNLMACAIQTTQFSQVEEVMDMMKADGVPIGNYVHSIYIRSLCRFQRKWHRDYKLHRLNKAFAYVEALGEKRKGHFDLSVEVFTPLIQGCISIGDNPRAWATFKHMMVWHCEPDTSLYNLMIRSCVYNGETEKAQALYNDILLAGFYPTEVTFNYLLRTYEKRQDRYNEMWGILEDMKKHGFAPEYNTILAILTNAAKSGDCETAELAFDELHMMPQDPYISIRKPWELMITAYARAIRHDYPNAKDYIEKGEKVFRMMLQQNITPDYKVMNAMLSCYTESFEVERALEWKQKYEELGIISNYATYYAFIKMYSFTRRMDQAMDLFHLMKKNKIRVRLNVYRSLLIGATRTRQIMTGMKILREMKEKYPMIDPNFQSIVNFRATLIATPHIMREIDMITGKALAYRPPWKKPGAIRYRTRMREPTKKEMRDEQEKKIQFLDRGPGSRER